MLPLAHLRSFPLELRLFDPLCEVHIEPPSVLACALREDIPPRLTSGL